MGAVNRNGPISAQFPCFCQQATPKFHLKFVFFLNSESFSAYLKPRSSSPLRNSKFRRKWNTLPHDHLKCTSYNCRVVTGNFRFSDNVTTSGPIHFRFFVVTVDVLSIHYREVFPMILGPIPHNGRKMRTNNEPSVEAIRTFKRWNFNFDVNCYVVSSCNCVERNYENSTHFAVFGFRTHFTPLNPITKKTRSGP